MSRVQYHNCLIFSFTTQHLHRISVLSRYTFCAVTRFHSCLAKMHNAFKSHVFYQFSVLSHEFKSQVFARSPFNLHIQHGFSIDKCQNEG